VCSSDLARVDNLFDQDEARSVLTAAYGA
jgi:hypothetical protein